MKLDFANALLICLCLVMLLLVFTLSASAAENDIIQVPVAPGNAAGIASSGAPFATYNNNTLYIGVSSTPCYAALYYGSGNSNIYILVISDTQQDITSSNLNGGAWGAGMSSVTIDGTTYYRGNSGTYPTSISTSYTIYSSQQAAQDAIIDYINTPEPTPSSSFDYTLPPGNVAYIPIASGQSSSIDFTLTTTYYMAFGNNDTSRINQVVTVMSSLPSTTNNVAPTSPKIPWTNNGNLNLLGVSANKIYQGSIPVNYGGQYLVVVNPMTMPSESGLIGGDTYTNGSINISVSAVSGSPYIYPMSESLIITPGDGIGSESSYGDTGYTYTEDPDTGEIIWSDPYGGDSAPVAGGNNPMPTPNTIFDWLRNISQQLSDFLRGPVQAVQVVVGAIRDFMGSFTQLYQWLPSPVYSLITSALMIALTIGVIKIFV